MLTLALALALNLGPTMGGPPVAAVASSGTVIDYTTSFALTGPATAAQCTNAAVTTTEGGAITVSRASTSYCQKDDGSYVLIDANKLVVEAEGLRTEFSSTNRVANSVTQNATWDLTGGGVGVTLTGTVADPWGGTTAQKWATLAGGGYLESPAFTITGTSAVMSLWAQNDDPAVTATVVLRDTTAGVNRCTISVNPSTSYSTTMYARPSCSSAVIVSGNSHKVRIFPGGASGDGTGFIATGVQVEPGITVKTSYIPTSGTAVTRAADVVTTTTADNSTAGCIKATFKATSPSFPQHIFSRSTDLAVFNNTTSFFSSDGTNTAQSPGVSNVTDRSVPLRVQWGGSSLRAELDSNTGTATSFDGSMGSGTTLYIGSNSGVQVYQGWIKALKFSTSTAGCL